MDLLSNVAIGGGLVAVSTCDVVFLLAPAAASVLMLCYSGLLLLEAGGPCLFCEG